MLCFVNFHRTPPWRGTRHFALPRMTRVAGRGLRQSLFLAIAAVAVLGLLLPALAIGGLWIAALEPLQARQAQRQVLDATLDQLASSLPELLWNLDAVVAHEVVDAAMSSAAVVHVRVTEHSTPGDFVAAGDASLAQAGLVGARDIVRKGVSLGRLEIGMSDVQAAAARTRQRWIYGATLGGQLLISLVLILALLNSRVMRPLRRLGEFADALADGQFAARLPKVLPDEIGALGQDLERMRIALKLQFGQQQALINRLQGLADTVPGVLFQLQRGADGRLQFAYVSEAAGQYLGVEVAELMRRPAAALSHVPEAERRAIWQGVQRSAELLTPWQQAFRLVDPRRGQRWLYVNAMAQSAACGGVLWHGFVTDITSQRQTLEELHTHREDLEMRVQQRTRALQQASTAAEAANRAKTVFLQNMSHEMRTPMNAIIGLTWLLRRDAANPQQAQRLDKVAQAAQHLLGVINNVLDLSKIEAGKLQLQLAAFDLEQLLATVLDMLGTRAHDKGLALYSAIDSRLRGRVLVGDAQRIAELLLNLLANAVKFTDAGAVRVSVVLVAEQGSNLDLRFEVEDSGIGIATAHQDQMFKHFEQIDGSSTRRHGGSGLGLAISRRLATLMEGEIGVLSEPGAGSRFWLTLRLPCLSPDPGQNAQEGADHADQADRADKGVGQAAVGHTPQPELQGRRVLLAEDDAVSQLVAVALLEDAGMHVQLANDGAQAVALAAHQYFDLVLLDVQMPGMDGLQACRLIRALPGYADLPILAMTANAFVEDRQQCLDAGMNDHVHKPVSPAQLFEVLCRWLSPSQAGPVGDAASAPGP